MTIEAELGTICKCGKDLVKGLRLRTKVLTILDHCSEKLKWDLYSNDGQFFCLHIRIKVLFAFPFRKHFVGLIDVLRCKPTAMPQK